jgi:hypothetical protein
LAKCRRWQAIKKPKSVTFYIRGCEGAAEPTVYLHRLIMGASEEMTVSHKDGDGLNNVRSNLVVATRSVSAAHAVDVLRPSDFKLAGEPIENKVITDFPLGPTIKGLFAWGSNGLPLPPSYHVLSDIVRTRGFFNSPSEVLSI